MSVTFSPATPESVSIAHNLACGCGAWVSSVVYPDYVSACKARNSGAVKSACVNDYCSYDGYLFPTPAVEFPELNLANSNARLVFDLLGVESNSELIGSICAEKLWELVAVVLDTRQLTDYESKVISNLGKVAEYSMVRGWEVSWG